jgi:anti-anti-sigma factor
MAGNTTSLAISAQTSDSVAVLTPRGTLDSGTYRQLRDEIIKAALEEPRAVIVDVTDLDVPAESALAVFTSARWHVDRWPKVSIMLVCEHPGRRSAIARSGITRYVSAYATVRAAMAHLDDTATMRRRRRARAELPATVSSLQRARELVVEWLSTWSRPEMIPVAKVVVTTLVENVLQHTESHPGIRLEYDGARVTIAVQDQSHTLPSVREHPGAVTRPSGLRILSALCRAWGNAPTPSGKTVWAVIGPENVL